MSEKKSPFYPKISNIEFICNNYLLKKLENNFFYDNITKRWYRYNGKIWIFQDDLEFSSIILKLLVEHETIENNIKLSFLNKVVLYLKNFLAKDINSIAIENNHKLLPFNNGVLNLSSYELLPYSNDYIFFNSYAVDYKSNFKMSIFFVAWLLQISQRNLLYLNIIRNYLYLLITKNNNYKVALYLHGPRGGGKYTFA